ncbi:OmpP1/FadL family transporter [Pollutimonas harenae]|uniref:TonB-dependent receptor n=1 Tax=Pollutimonas harenae TaxID=657015 RepID=A0A853GXY9_9BURK|nr:outer membrane protein transport protein [Pollutimonas harenae]NYT84650.1 TonB-dependent receptor [Pollutimonas harenae]TEA72946.1 fatty acid transporter [Pollutimonas harenae]
MKAVKSLRVVSAVVLSLGAGGAHAAGFQLLEQNASGIGNAYAGSAAIAENASTIFFNPAGMTRLPGVNVSGGLIGIRPSFKFHDDGSTGPGGLPLGTNNGGDAGSLAAVPNAYISWEVNPSWFVGLGIGAPFGLMTEYDEGWIGRYHSKKFKIKSININPSVAYKVNDQLSIGAGVNWLQLDANYRRNSPAAGLISRLPGGMANPLAPRLLGAPDLEAQAKLKGDAWGWNLGLLYQATPDTRIGLSYRSKVKIDTSGDTNIDNPTPVPIPTHFDASADVELPDTAILSVVHDLNSKWQLLADVSWTGWSSIKTLKIDNGYPPLNDELDLRFRDTWRVALGANYRLNHQWTLKGGVAWDQSPVDSSKYRPTSLPDNDRYWVSIGAQYNFNDQTTIDIGYAHLFLNNTSIDNDTDAATKGTVRGEYTSNANMLGIQVSHRF